MVPGTSSNQNNKMVANNDIDNNGVWNVLPFPDFLSYVLLYISDQVIWNAIASSNKDMHKKSKSILPPWPKIYQLPASNSASSAVWAPDGTHVAHAYDYGRDIAIVDQRRGVIHIINNNRGRFYDLKFSPDCRCLVSADSWRS